MRNTAGTPGGHTKAKRGRGRRAQSRAVTHCQAPSCRRCAATSRARVFTSCHIPECVSSARGWLLWNTVGTPVTLAKPSEAVAVARSRAQSRRVRRGPTPSRGPQAKRGSCGSSRFPMLPPRPHAAGNFLEKKSGCNKSPGCNTARGAPQPPLNFVFRTQLYNLR